MPQEQASRACEREAAPIAPGAQTGAWTADHRRRGSRSSLVEVRAETAPRAPRCGHMGKAVRSGACSAGTPPSCSCGAGSWSRRHLASEEALSQNAKRELHRSAPRHAHERVECNFLCRVRERAIVAVGVSRPTRRERASVRALPMTGDMRTEILRVPGARRHHKEISHHSGSMACHQSTDTKSRRERRLHEEA